MADPSWSDEALASQGLRPPWDNTKMTHRDRVHLFPEIFGFFDPDMLAPSPEPPAHVQAAFEDVLGDEAKLKRGHGRPNLILRLHPWFRRWTIFAFQSMKGRDVGNGMPMQAWQPVMICTQAALPEAKHSVEHRPHDLRDRRYSELWGRVGEYKEPDRRDFEDFKDVCDRQRMEANERRRFLEARRDAETRAKDSRMADYERDLCDYGFAAYYRDLVQVIGGGQGLPFMPTNANVGDGRVHFPVMNDVGEVAFVLKVRANDWIRAYEEEKEREAGANGGADPDRALSDAGLMRLFEHFRLLSCEAAIQLQRKRAARDAIEHVLGGPRPKRNLHVGSSVRDSVIAEVETRERVLVGTSEDTAVANRIEEARARTHAVVQRTAERPGQVK